MISETELSDLLAEAAAAISEPSGSERVLEAAGGGPPSSPARMRSPRVLVGALSIAAIIALVVVLVVRSSSPPVQIDHAAAPLTPVAGGALLGPNSTAAAAKRLAAGATNPAASTSPNAARQEIVASGTLSLTVHAASLSQVVDRLQSIASALGGYVTRSNVALAGARGGGSVVLGIPAGVFRTAITDAEKLGTVEHLATAASDVTGQVADLGAQVTALVDAWTQLEALLSRAGSIPALLSVENQISNVQSQIEQLQSEQRVLSNQVSYSSLTVSLALPSVHRASVSSGFAKAWHDAVSGFVGGLHSLLANSGVVVFSLLLAAIVGLLVVLASRGLWSLLRRRVM